MRRKRPTAEEREDKRRLDLQLHRQLDQVCDLSKKLAAARLLCQSDLKLETVDLLRRAALHRLAQIRKTVGKLRPPSKDGWLFNDALSVSEQ